MHLLNQFLFAFACVASLMATEPAKAADVSTQFQQLASQYQVCAAALVYIKAGQIQEPVFANGCEETRMPDSDSIFQAASLGKPVFAYAVLGLVTQGKLALDAPLMQYLPQGYQHASQPGDSNSAHELVTDGRLQKVTARMVLQHTTGLPNWASGHLDFQFEPGARWQYSGEGFMLLQAVVEAITGMELEAWMQQQVFAPLGMLHSSYQPGKAWQDHLICGSLHGKALSLRVPRHAVAAASLHASVTDYARFVQAVLRDESAITRILANPVITDQQSNVQWGLGWGLTHPNSAGQGVQSTLLWHWGNNYGYRAFVIADPATGNGMVMLTNSDQGLKLAEAMTANIIPGQLSLFQFPMLGLKPGFACQVLGIC
ncbi:serine hydrolase domain-containing protein [Undibacterium sp. TJN19]|uniref:serine hydrolase domain-containing protein n=1 Tax=Undibacterium sp. TJN19 TaxID=3413055 RepID=UPI003BEFCFB7